MKNKIWKPVYGFENLYEMTIDGEIRSIGKPILRKNGRPYTPKKKIIKTYINRDGYVTCYLYNENNKKVTCYIHRLVLLTFLGKSSDPAKNEVNHIDENKLNNSIENLEWCTRQYNSTYGTISIRKSLALKKNAKRTPVDMFTLDDKYIRSFDSVSDASNFIGCKSKSNITAVLKGYYESTHGYKFKYTNNMNKVQRFKEITSDMAETYERKNNDYSDSFGQSIRDFGFVAGIVRISDKFNRLKSLLSGKEQKVNDESVQDTLLDMANYCIMLKMEMENGQGTKNE